MRGSVTELIGLQLQVRYSLNCRSHALRAAGSSHGSKRMSHGFAGTAEASENTACWILVSRFNGVDRFVSSGPGSWGLGF